MSANSAVKRKYWLYCCQEAKKGSMYTYKACVGIMNINAHNKRGLVMKRSLPKVILAVIIICFISSSAPAATSDTFRCPNGSLIRINDRLETVTKKCGPPTTRSVRGGLTGYADAQHYGSFDTEEWVYNFGPTSFIMYLTFTNGVLASIESGEYGY